MNNGKDWEADIDWTKIEPVGGRGFYEYIKTQCLPVLDTGIDGIEKVKAKDAGKLERWNRVGKIATRLARDYDDLTASEDFTRIIHEFDEKTKADRPAGYPTIERWIEMGKYLTRALCGGSKIPGIFQARLTTATRDLVTAKALRDLLRNFIAACDDDYRLRCAPVKFRTRVFRNLAREINAVVAAGVQLNFESAPDFIRPLEKDVRTIHEEARRTQRVIRTAKKSIERHGDAFWADLAEWERLKARG